MFLFLRFTFNFLGFKMTNISFMNVYKQLFFVKKSIQVFDVKWSSCVFNIDKLRGNTKKRKAILRLSRCFVCCKCCFFFQIHLVNYTSLTTNTTIGSSRSGCFNNRYHLRLRTRPQIYRNIFVRVKSIDIWNKMNSNSSSTDISSELLLGNIT